MKVAGIRTFWQSCSGKLLQHPLESVNISPQTLISSWKWTDLTNENCSHHRPRSSNSGKMFRTCLENQCIKVTLPFHKCRNTFLLKLKKKITHIPHMLPLFFTSNI